MATIKTMHEAFLHELSDTYSAEKQLTDAIQGMLDLATNPQVKQGLERHITETKQHIKNLDQIFKSLGEKPENVTCKGTAGIISEFKSGAKEIKEPALLDGFIAAGGLKGEHYEIATYRGLVGKAQLMGHADAAQLLQENLQMEERFAQQLEQVDLADVFARTVDRRAQAPRSRWLTPGEGAESTIDCTGNATAPRAFGFVLFLSVLIQLWALTALRVGQNVLAAHADERAQADHETRELLHAINTSQLEILQKLQQSAVPAGTP